MILCEIQFLCSLYSECKSSSFICELEVGDLIFVDSDDRVIWSESMTFRGIKVVMMNGTQGYIFGDLNEDDPYREKRIKEVTL